MKTRLFCIFSSLLAALISGVSLCAMRQAVSFESIGKGTVLRLATCTRENHLDTTAALYFAHLVHEKTEGQIQVQVIPNGELGDERASVEQLEFGGIAFSMINCYALPEECLVLDGDILTPRRDKLNTSRIELLASLAPDRRCIASKDILPAKDSTQSALRIGAYPSKFLIDKLQALGFSVLTSDVKDMIGAIHYGYVDSVELSLLTYATKEYAQALPVLSFYDGPISPDVLLASQVSMGNLPTEQQQIVRECAILAAEYQQRSLSAQQEDCLAALKKQGIRIFESEP